MRQIKRKRPTLATAHEFHRSGSYLRSAPEHLVSDEEREALSEAAFRRLEQLLKDQFPRSGNLEYAILKAHLITEYAITEYIRCLSTVLVDPSDIRFTFFQKLEFAYLMGLGVTDPVLLPTIERLNKIRNQVAHSFTIDRALVDEMLRVNSEDYADFKIKDDRERVRRLRWLCNLLAGHISAQIAVQIYFRRTDTEAPPATLDRRE